MFRPAARRTPLLLGIAIAAPLIATAGWAWSFHAAAVPNQAVANALDISTGPFIGHTVTEQLFPEWILSMAARLGVRDFLEAEGLRVVSVDLQYDGPSLDVESEDAVRTVLDNLSGCERLAHLSVSGPWFTNELVPLIHRVPRLERLEISNSSITDAAFAHLGGIASLKELSVSSRRTLTATCLAELARLPRLEDLAVKGHEESPFLWGPLVADIPRFPRLTSLDLSGSEIQGNPIEAMRVLAAIETLRELNLSGVAEIDVAALAPLAAMPNLRGLALLNTNLRETTAHAPTVPSKLGWLHISGSGASDALIAAFAQHGTLTSLSMGDTVLVTNDALAAVAHCRNLTDLDVSHTAIDDAGLNSIAGLTRLRSLNLSHTYVTGAGVRRLSRLNALVRLQLADTELDDAGLEIVAHWPALAVLDVSETLITDAGLPSLHRCASLRMIRLNGTDVTSNGLRQLEHALNPGRRLHPVDSRCWVCPMPQQLQLEEQLRQFAAENERSHPELLHDRRVTAAVAEIPDAAQVVNEGRPAE